MVNTPQNDLNRKVLNDSQEKVTEKITGAIEKNLETDHVSIRNSEVKHLLNLKNFEDPKENPISNGVIVEGKNKMPYFIEKGIKSYNIENKELVLLVKKVDSEWGLLIDIKTGELWGVDKYLLLDSSIPNRIPKLLKIKTDELGKIGKNIYIFEDGNSGVESTEGYKALYNHLPQIGLSGNLNFLETQNKENKISVKKILNSFFHTYGVPKDDFGNTIRSFLLLSRQLLELGAKKEEILNELESCYLKHGFPEGKIKEKIIKFEQEL